MRLKCWTRWELTCWHFGVCPLSAHYCLRRSSLKWNSVYRWAYNQNNIILFGVNGKDKLYCLYRCNKISVHSGDFRRFISNRKCFFSLLLSLCCCCYAVVCLDHFTIMTTCTMKTERRLCHVFICPLKWMNFSKLII